MRFFNKTYCLTLLTVVSGLVVSAQEHESPKNVLTLEMQDSLATWRNSLNAAGLVWDKPLAFSRVETRYSLASGDFKRPQAASRVSGIGIHGTGNTHIKQYYVQGFFSYRRDNLESASFNASLIDPLRSMPYGVLDSNSSDWVNQHYTMGFDLASPAYGDKISFGLGVRYQAASGSKQRDIRAVIDQYALQLRPSFSYAIRPTHIVGLHVSYDNTKEESGNSNVNTYVDQGYYLHYGLGHAVPYVGGGTTLNYEGDQWGAGLQYEFKGPWSLFATTSFSVGAESANIGFLAARTEGIIARRKSETSLRVKREYQDKIHVVDVAYLYADNEGIEFWNEFISGLDSEGYVNRHRAVRSTYQRKLLRANYAFVTRKAQIYNWKLDAGFVYSKQDDRYLLPSSVLGIEHIGYGLSLQKAFSLRTSMLSIGGKVWKQQHISGRYQYGGKRADELPVTQLLRGDQLFLSADHLRIEIPITYSRPIGQNGDQSIYAKANAFWSNPSGNLFTRRQGIQLSIGATF